jgi:hypothetical protein
VFPPQLAKNEGISADLVSMLFAYNEQKRAACALDPRAARRQLSVLHASGVVDIGTTMTEAFPVVKGEEGVVFDALVDRIELKLPRNRLELPGYKWEELDINDVFMPMLESVVDELPYSRGSGEGNI